MRPDMAKVVTERPRSGSRSANRASRRRYTPAELRDLNSDYEADGSRADYLDHDDGGCRQKMSHYADRQHKTNLDPKSFSDVLGPLRGYLRKQVGRPWNKVYSELCAHLDRRGISGAHIWDHVKREVHTNTWKGVSGRIYVNDGAITDMPIDGDHHMVARVDGVLYVHPVTGLLCATKGRASRHSGDWERRRDFRRALSAFGIIDPLDREERRFRIQDPLTLWEKRGDFWFIHFYRHVPEHIETRTNHVTGKDYQVTVPARRDRIRSKQANSKELRAAAQLLATAPF